MRNVIIIIILSEIINLHVYVTRIVKRVEQKKIIRRKKVKQNVLIDSDKCSNCFLIQQQQQQEKKLYTTYKISYERKKTYIVHFSMLI